MAGGFYERGGGWVLTQSALMVLVLVGGPLTPGASAEGLRLTLAAALLLAGAGFGIGGAWVLGRNRTIFPRPNAGSRLVTGGIYRWVRHPLYASLMFLSFAWALYWSSWPTALAALVLTVFLRAKAAREEAWLREHFPGYADYAGRVRRFFPGVW
ncbi:MAG: isoprenylcysteine carboxylmethyltransferase family protein [Verrucomicrobiales bacterium]|nr:isoprenylcysteine carboxylmethyltransferase family protein [Verrucomicrobiales bacterium]